MFSLEGRKEHKRNSTDYKITDCGSREARVAGGWEGAALGAALSTSHLLFWDTDPSGSVTESYCGRAAKPRRWPAQPTLLGDRARQRGPGVLVRALPGLARSARRFPARAAAWRQLLPGTSSEPGGVELGKLPRRGAGCGQLTGQPAKSASRPA